MKRSRFSRRNGLPTESEALLQLATGLAEAGSYAEALFWENKLAAVIDQILLAHKEDVLEATLDHLYTANHTAYGALADVLEACTESGADANPSFSAHNQSLLLAAPMLAWSRFSIPAGILSASVLANLRVHLSTHILAPNVHLSLANVLFSPDQLPQGFAATAALAARLTETAQKNKDLHIDKNTLSATSRYLSDVRYILAVVTAPKDQPLFRWQEKNCTREQAAAQWRTLGSACLAPIMAGCAMELTPPDGFFSACRHADEASRPYSVRASTAFLCATMDVLPGSLRAIVAPFYEQQLEEYRISFTLRGEDNVIHGVIWPLLDMEDEEDDIPDQIKTVLRECGIDTIEFLENRFATEYCEDCGAPLYPTADGETTHAELPEDKADAIPRHMH